MRRRQKTSGQAPTLERHFAGSEELCQYVRQVSGDTVILSFSLGKDAWAAWAQLRRYFRRIVPFHLVTLPGLRFVEDELARAEDVLGEKIHRYPHPGLVRMLSVGVYQTPERLALCDAVAALPSYNYEAVEKHVRAATGLPEAFVANGARAADSPARLANIRKHGSLNPKRRSFFPVYDWKKDRVVDELRQAGVRLPVDYELFGRSFDGIDFRFLEPIRRRFPDDYQRILKWFPLADADIARRLFLAREEARAAGRPLPPINTWTKNPAVCDAALG